MCGISPAFGGFRYSHSHFLFWSHGTTTPNIQSRPLSLSLLEASQLRCWENLARAFSEANQPSLFRTADPVQSDGIAILKELPLHSPVQLDGFLSALADFEHAAFAARFSAADRAGAEKVSDRHWAAADGMMRQHLWEREQQIAAVGVEDCGGLMALGWLGLGQSMHCQDGIATGYKTYE